ncbi:DNA ligase (ATP) [Rhodotorula sphaerocarpa]
MPKRFYGKRDADAAADDEQVDAVLQRAQPDDVPKPAAVYNTSALQFGVLCSIFDELERATRTRRKHKAESKADMVAHFFLLYRERIGNDFYPLIRLMLPERDTRRRTYNLKEQKLAKAIVDALDLPKSSSAANKLNNWKTPTKEDGNSRKTVAYDVIRSRSTVTSSRSDTTIESINNVLDQLSKTTSIGLNGEKRPLAVEHARILRRCVNTMTPGEMKWLIRIILRDLKIGVGEKTIFDRLHPDAMAVFNTCSDIMKVCYELYDPNFRVKREDMIVRINESFTPMLCWRSHTHLEDVVKAMHRQRSALDPNRKLEPGEYGNREFILEEKLDGERIQLHKQGDRYKYWSRKAIDYTNLYGDRPTQGSLTPFIQQAIDDKVEEVILDGEMLVWEPHMQKYMAFGNLKSFAKNKVDDVSDFDPRPCYKVFDILHIKGKNGAAMSLLDKPLWRRKLLLQQILKDKTGVIEIADCAKASTKEEIHAFLVRILEERGEGLVVKHPLSRYHLGAREDTWIKVKPDYMDELGEQIDGLVIGGYWGQGRRGGGMASFLIGLSASQNGKTIYHTFAKVGSGFSRGAYEEIARKTDGKWRPFDRKQPPDWFHTISEWPDRIIEPKEYVPYDYGAGLTLRFPRAKDIMKKKPEDAMDYETILAFRRKPKRTPFGEDLSARNKRVKAARSVKRHAVAEPIGEVDAESDLFSGTTFYVHRTEPEEYKTELKRQIAAHGGTLIEKIPDPAVDRVVVSCAFTGLKNRKGAKDCDVVTPEWVKDSIANKQRMPLQKRYLVHATAATMESAAYVADEAKPDLELMLTDSEEDIKPTLPQSGLPLTITAPVGSNEHWRQRHDLDAEESEPDTEDEDNTYELPEEPGTESDTAAETGKWSTLFPRQQTLPAPVNAMNRRMSELDLEEQGAQVKEEPDAVLQKLKLDPEAYTDAPPGMGAGEEVTQTFDPDKWFAPYVAYFDTQANASQNSLATSVASVGIKAEADKTLAKAQTAFEEAGGKVTEALGDPKLTHIIVSRLVPDRYKELIQRTMLPRARRIVTTGWIDACMDEEGAMDEDDFKP